MHGHCNMIFHHDINTHKNFSYLLFQVFNTVIHSIITFTQNKFSSKLKRDNFPFFSLAYSAIAQLSEQWKIAKSS